MQAASDGWRVCYIGGNRFEFHETCNDVQRTDVEANAFVNRYHRSLEHFFM